MSPHNQVRHLMRQWQAQKTAQVSESGFSLMEVLIAILVITIVVSVMTPSILMVAATRLQNQRAEQALQAAQGQIDRMRSEVERGRSTASDTATTVYKNKMPPLDSATNAQSAPAPTALAAGATSPICPPDGGTAYPSTSTSMCFIDLSKNGKFDDADLALQIFRTQDRTLSTSNDLTQTIPVAFVMGVRVYTYRTVTQSSSLSNVAPATLGFTSGELKDGQPLAALYLPVARSDVPGSLKNYCQILNSVAASSTTGPCPN